MTTVLAIEDESSILDNILEILRLGGMDAHGAMDGLEGIEKAFKLNPDLILCDINMPEMDGYGVLMEIRSDPRTSHIPFIFLTAYVDRPFQRRGMNMGAADYLTKPFNAKELLDTVKAQLEKHEEQEARRTAEVERLRNNMVMALPHELRTPLTGIISCADILLMDFDDQITPDIGRIEQMLRIIHRSGQRLQHLIENYLIYSQIELYTSDPEKMPPLTRGEGLAFPTLVTKDVAADVAESVQRADDLTIRKSVDAEVKVTRANLVKIVSELVSNAFKFSAEGKPVTVETDIDDGEFRLRVIDEGRGLSKEAIAILGAYMQFDRSIYEQQGIGLGLIIAKRLAELHGGRLLVDSTEGEGTTITVYLPLMPHQTTEV